MGLLGAEGASLGAYKSESTVVGRLDSATRIGDHHPTFLSPSPTPKQHASDSTPSRGPRGSRSREGEGPDRKSRQQPTGTAPAKGHPGLWNPKKCNHRVTVGHREPVPAQAPPASSRPAMACITSDRRDGNNRWMASRPGPGGESAGDLATESRADGGGSRRASATVRCDCQ